MLCIERLRQFLLGIHFKIICDCQALLYLNAHITVNSQVAKIVLLLEEYYFEIIDRKGDKMVSLGYLSSSCFALLLSTDLFVSKIVKKNVSEILLEPADRVSKFTNNESMIGIKDVIRKFSFGVLFSTASDESPSLTSLFLFSHLDVAAL